MKKGNHLTIYDWLLFLARRDIVVSEEIRRIEAHLGIETGQKFNEYTAANVLGDLESKEHAPEQEGSSE